MKKDAAWEEDVRCASLFFGTPQSWNSWGLLSGQEPRLGSAGNGSTEVCVKSCLSALEKPQINRVCWGTGWETWAQIKVQSLMEELMVQSVLEKVTTCIPRKVNTLYPKESHYPVSPTHLPVCPFRYYSPCFLSPHVSVINTWCIPGDSQAIVCLSDMSDATKEFLKKKKIQLEMF